MCQFAPSVTLGARPSLFKFVWVLGRLSQEAEDILDRVHIRTRDRARLLSPIGEDSVGMGRIGRQPQHLGANRRELVDREISERGLERGELAAAEALEHV